jgi:hypothetical protein
VTEKHEQPDDNDGVVQIVDGPTLDVRLNASHRKPFTLRRLNSYLPGDMPVEISLDPP